MQIASKHFIVATEVIINYQMYVHEKKCANNSPPISCSNFKVYIYYWKNHFVCWTWISLLFILPPKMFKLVQYIFSSYNLSLGPNLHGNRYTSNLDTGFLFNRNWMEKLPQRSSYPLSPKHMLSSS